MSNLFEKGHALLVGVGADLPNTIDDANGIADILKDSNRCAYPSEQVKLLTGNQAIRENILTAFDELAKRTDPDSTVIIFYSGHGYRVMSSVGIFHYIMPFGYDISNLNASAISGMELIQRLQAIPAQKLVLLLDCCHAGGVGDAKITGLEFTKSPLPPEVLSFLAQGRGKVVIASSTEVEVSFAGKPYSAFTLALIESFSGIGVAKNDGYVRVADLALHAREVVPGRTNNRQHPILHFEQADNFILAYYAGGDTKSRGLPFDIMPEIETDPGVWTRFDQRGQTIYGNQTNITGGVKGPVLSGNIHGNVRLENSRDSIRIGNINASTGVAIGRGAQSIVNQQNGLIGDEISQAFFAIRQTLTGLHEAQSQANAREAIDSLEVEARRGIAANEDRVRRWFSFLAKVAPDVWDVAITKFSNPIQGLNIVFKEIAERASFEKPD